MDISLGLAVGIERTDILRKIHCHPFKPYFPSSFSIAAPIRGEMAFPPNIPKKKMPTRFASSALAYHFESVYREAGMYPASASPSRLRTTRKPVRLRRNTWKVAMVPNARTCAGIHLSGPSCVFNQGVD